MRRWSVRVKLLVGFAPLAVLMLVFAAKVLVMVSVNESGREAYAQQAYETAEADFARNRRGDLLQDWVASYNRGTTLVRMHRYEEARADLERALARVPAEYDCRVRINLVLAMEGQADDLMTQQQAVEAERIYAAARELLRQGSCGEVGSTSPSPGTSGSQSSSRRPSSKQPSTATSGQPSTGRSGQPTTGQPQNEPTSPEQRREQEQQQAQDADQRLDDKQKKAQKEAEEQRRRESRRATATSSAPSPRSSADPQQQESSLNDKNREGQQSNQEAKDRDDRSVTPTASAQRPW